MKNAIIPNGWKTNWQGLDLWTQYTEQAIHYTPQFGDHMPYPMFREADFGK